MSKPATAHSYQLTVSLSVLNDLGINLYSNLPAVISEVVANAWDADSTVVKIEFGEDNKTLTITDDGCGMDEKDINDKYLNVGYKRREAGLSKTPIFKRKVMGRKGIGKLSLFSIADTIQVESIKMKNGKIVEKNGLIMNGRDIEKSIKEKKASYLPKVIEEKDIDIKKGTRITLSDLKKSISGTEGFLRKRLARRFSIIGKDTHFSVFIKNKPISAEDRNYFQKLDYLWVIGEKPAKAKKLVKDCTRLKKHSPIDGIIDKDSKYTIRGWVGTFNEQKNIEEGNNSIIVMSRGKLIHEDILKDLKEGGLFTKYVIGEINADFLDSDSDPDMATSDRQSLKEDDHRFKILKDFVQTKVLKEIQSKWNDWRKEDSTKEALQNKTVKEWYQTLGPDRKKYARKLFGTIGSFPADSVDAKRELYKHGILAFEKLALKDTLSEIDNISAEADFHLLKTLFSGIDEIEAIEYYYIAKGRLDVLKKFENLVPKSKERVIQEHIFDHLWLLDASWERASADERMEESVTKEFKGKDVKLTAEEKKARLDIRYKTAATKHIIIELKKYTAKTEIHALCKQVQKYKSALEKCLQKKFPNESNEIEIICILGEPPTPKNQPEVNRNLLREYNARYITYDTLIKETQKSYGNYLEKQKKVAKLLELIERI